MIISIKWLKLVKRIFPSVIPLLAGDKIMVEREVICLIKILN